MEGINVRKRFVLLGCAIAMLGACASDDDSASPEKRSSGYLPLSVGNYWDFKSVRDPAGGVVQHREVNSVVQLNGRQYYLLTSHRPQADAPIDSVYYRVEPDGDVYTYQRSTGVEELRYKVFADDGDSWSFPYYNDTEMTVTLHKGTVDTERKTVDDCKNYYFDSEQWADEEYTYTLGPGVGFIREYSNGWGLGIVLSKASIGGDVIEY